jgi:hypothetical protein
MLTLRLLPPTAHTVLVGAWIDDARTIQLRVVLQARHAVHVEEIDRGLPAAGFCSPAMSAPGTSVIML